MRPSKFDKYICVICLIVFFYSFFVLYCEPVFESDIKYPDKQLWVMDDGKDEMVAVEWSSAVFVAPVFCIVFFFLIIFWRELLPVDRHFVVDKIKCLWCKHKK